MGFEEDKEEGGSVDQLSENDARDLLLVSPARIGGGERMCCSFFFFFNIYFQQLNQKIAKI